VTNFCFAASDTTKVRSSVIHLANKISKYKTVDDRVVGFAGVASEQYKRFYSLTQLAIDDELISLTDYKNEKVRAYAFWALAKRNYKDIKTILEKHLSDTTSFDFFQGCIQSPQRINYFFLDILTPNHIDAFCFKLTTKEVNDYYKKIMDTTKQTGG
jgi:hypothetical protein